LKNNLKRYGSDFELKSNMNIQRTEYKKRIVVFPQKEKPLEHPMLSRIFGKILPDRNYDVTWIVQSSSHSKLINRVSWGNTQAVLVKKKIGRGTIGKFLKGFYWQIIYIIFAFKTCLSIKPDYLFVRNSVFAGMMALFLRWCHGTRIIFQLSFLIPESLLLSADEGRIKVPTLQRPYAKLVIKVRTWLLNRVDMVLMISDEMVRQIAPNLSHISHVRVFPLGVDVNPKINEEFIKSVRELYGIRGKRVILYFGVLDPSRKMETIIESMIKVIAEVPNVVLMFLGPDHNGKEVDRLKSFSERFGISKNIIFIGRVPLIEVPNYISLSEFTLSPYPEIPLFQVASPTKAVESLAMKKAVIATRIPDQSKLISESGGGIIVPYESGEFANAILKLLKNPELTRSMGVSGYNYIIRERNYEKLASDLENWFAELNKL